MQLTVADIEEAIKREVSHFPQAKTALRELRRLVQKEYDRLWASHDWDFAYREVDLKAKADSEFTVPLTNGSEQVDLTSASVTQSADDWAGGELVASDGTVYEIRGDNGAKLLYLHEAWAGTSATHTVTLRYRQYRLPSNIRRMISILDPDGNALDYKDRNHIRRMGIDVTDTGDPTFWFKQPSMRTEDLYWDPTVWTPPRLTAPRAGTVAPISPTVTVQPGGSLAAGTYRYRVTIGTRGGWWMSGPGEVHEVKTDVPKTIQTTRFAFTDSLSSNFYYFIWRDENHSGEYVLVKIAQGTGAPQNVDDDNGADIQTQAQKRKVLHEFRYPFHPDRNVIPQNETYGEFNQYEHMEMHPWPDADDTYTLAYYCKPRPLLHESDIPQLPEEFHEILVYLVAERILARAGARDDADRNRVLAFDLTNQMHSSYQDHFRTTRIAQAGMEPRRGLNLGTASLT